MGESRLSPEELAAMTQPAWERAKRAADAGDAAAVRREIDAAVARWRSLQTYSIEWITSLLSFIGRELGEEAVERALREFGDGYLSQRRQPDGAPEWNDLPAAARAKAIARAMVANFGTCEVSEDDDAITLSFRCGTGGRLIDDARYEGDDGYLVLREQGPRTFGRDALPVYCAHCSVNNEIQAIERTGYPVTVESPPAAPGDACVHVIHRRLDGIPAEVYARVGRTKPPS